MFYIYTDAYFSSEFIIFNFLHMFVLPDVASFGVAGVGLLLIMFCISDVPCAFNATFHIILSYKFSVVFSYDIRCISMTCMHISIYMWVCQNDIFINMFNIFFNFLHISSWIFSHKSIVYKVLNGFSLPDVSSSVIPVSSVVWVVFSVTLIRGEDTTSNKLEICIDRC